MSLGWAKASACRLKSTLYCAFRCHIVSIQYLSRSSLHRLAPCRIFLSYGLQVVTREVHRSSLRRLICPARDHFICLTVLIISMTCVLSLTHNNNNNNNNALFQAHMAHRKTCIYNTLTPTCASGLCRR